MERCSRAPSDFLMERFDAINEFEREIVLVGSHFTLSSIRNMFRCETFGCLPHDKRLLIMDICARLEKVIGSDDRYWEYGR